MTITRYAVLVIMTLLKGDLLAKNFVRPGTTLAPSSSGAEDTPDPFDPTAPYLPAPYQPALPINHAFPSPSIPPSALQSSVLFNLPPPNPPAPSPLYGPMGSSSSSTSSSPGLHGEELMDMLFPLAISGGSGVSGGSGMSQADGATQTVSPPSVAAPPAPAQWMGPMSPTEFIIHLVSEYLCCGCCCRNCND